MPISFKIWLNDIKNSSFLQNLVVNTTSILHNVLVHTVKCPFNAAVPQRVAQNAI